MSINELFFKYCDDVLLYIFMLNTVIRYFLKIFRTKSMISFFAFSLKNRFKFSNCNTLNIVYNSITTIRNRSIDGHPFFFSFLDPSSSRVSTRSLRRTLTHIISKENKTHRVEHPSRPRSNNLLLTHVSHGRTAARRTRCDEIVLFYFALSFRQHCHTSTTYTPRKYDDDINPINDWRRWY